jgi:hypothetical protein
LLELDFLFKLCIFIVYTIKNMKKQEKVLTMRVDEELKTKFNQKAEDNYMTLSARIKYLMKMDIEGNIIIKGEK